MIKFPFSDELQDATELTNYLYFMIHITNFYNYGPDLRVRKFFNERNPVAYLTRKSYAKGPLVWKNTARGVHPYKAQFFQKVPHVPLRF